MIKCNFEGCPLTSDFQRHWNGSKKLTHEMCICIGVENVVGPSHKVNESRSSHMDSLMLSVQHSSKSFIHALSLPLSLSPSLPHPPSIRGMVERMSQKYLFPKLYKPSFLHTIIIITFEVLL
jgi:hypothetical protein